MKTEKKITKTKLRTRGSHKKQLVLFFIATFAIIYALYMVIIQSMINDQKTRYRYLAINEANYINSCIDKVVGLTYMLREMLYESNGDDEFFSKVAPQLYTTVAEDTGVSLRNVAIAPDNIVKEVYPLEGNESFVGFNYQDKTKLGNAEAIMAYEKGQTIITNPFELMQGGTGMSIRTPVYVLKDGEKVPWGMVSATMDFDNLLNAFQLENLAKMNLDYRIWYTNDAGEKVVIAETDARLTNGVTHSFSVYNLKWNIDIEPVDGWYSFSTDLIAKFIILLLSFGLTLLVAMFLRIRDDGRKMKIIAEQDSLTHCYSRHYLNSVILNSDTANWHDTEHCFSLAIVDLDYFKSVNDKYGHTVGDIALVNIAKILQSYANRGPYDSVIRYGGDEFIVCFNNTTRQKMEEAVAGIVETVRALTLVEIPDLKLTVSIGAVVNNKENPLPFNELIQLADANLYRVKEKGRNDFYIT